MSRGFRRKALLRESSVGLRLQSRRVALGLSLEEIEIRTHIRAHYLLALEAGRVEQVPSVYILGFLRQYATALGLDPDELVRLFSRERQPWVSSALRFSPKHLEGRSVVEITPKRLFAFSLASFFGLMVFLVGLQVVRFSAVPTVELYSPTDRFIPAPTGEVEFSGLVVGQKELTLNSQPVVTTPEGNFSEKLHFGPGVTSVELVATGRRGKVSRRLFTVSVPQPNARNN